MEYYPQGFVERVGNLWRAQGRRARLELKHFRRHVMMNTILAPDDVEGWRGEIEDGEVTFTHDEIVQEEQRAAKEAEDNDGSGDDQADDDQASDDQASDEESADDEAGDEESADDEADDDEAGDDQDRDDRDEDQE
jgi:hypothetical protein